MQEKIKIIQDQIANAIEQHEPLKIVGGDSKAFLGRNIVGTSLEMSDYSGVINYEPTELYITVRAGTTLNEINNTLAKHGQMLVFEPPQVNAMTTIGGVVATGLSGPRRPYSGSVRDYVLGVHCINGLGKELTFGGQVMKNVAGYDLSRLMTGAYGTLGVILDISLKVMPLPEFELTCHQSLSLDDALAKMLELSALAIPLSASCYDGEALFIRLSGDEKVVKTSSKTIGMDVFEQARQFWNELRDYKSSIFNSKNNIWRLSVPVTSVLDVGNEPCLIEWGGGLYWLDSKRPAEEIFNLASAAGGNAMLFKGTDPQQEIFQPLTDGLLSLHKNLKNAFDPHGVLNPGKMYATI